MKIVMSTLQWWIAKKRVQIILCATYSVRLGKYLDRQNFMHYCK